MINEDTKKRTNTHKNFKAKEPATTKLRNYKKLTPIIINQNNEKVQIISTGNAQRKEVDHNSDLPQDPSTPFKVLLILSNEAY